MSTWSYSMDGETNYARIYLHGEGKPCKIKGSDVLRGYCGKRVANTIAHAPDLLQELKNIANADTKDWDDPKDFKAWAQSRARTLVAKIEEQS